MVLGLGSRSKKDRASAVSQLVEFELHLHEIKPWHGLAKPGKTPLTVALRWGRAGKLTGSSRNVTCSAASGPEAGKISIGESLRTAVAPNREVLKKAKKLYPDLDEPLIFTLYDANDSKGKPLAQASLELSSLASITESKLIAVPFIISKKVAKGSPSFLHLTVQKQQEDRPYSPAASASLDASGRTSDASSLAPLDEDTQQKLVAALMSDSDGTHNSKDEEIDSFTDEDVEVFNTPAVTKDIRSSQGNGVLRSPQKNATAAAAAAASAPVGNVAERATREPARSVVETAASSLMHEKAEKQPESKDGDVSRQAVAPPQASSVKAAAIAAAAAYSKKYSFTPKRTNSSMNDRDNSSSDLDSAEEDEFLFGFSKIAETPNISKGPSNSASYLQANTSASRASNTVSNASLEKDTEAKLPKQQDGQSATQDAGKVFVVEKDKSLLNRKVLEESKEAMKKGESKGLVKAMSTASVDLNSSWSTKERNKSSTGSTSESEVVSITDVGLQRRSSSDKNASQKVEITPAKPPVRSERDAMLKTEAKQSHEQIVKPSVKTPLKDRGQQKSVSSKSPDPMKVTTNQSPASDFRAIKTGTQEGKAKTLKSPDRESARVDKKEVHDTRQKSMYAEGKAASMQPKSQQMEAEVEKLKGELRDVAALEAALYSTTAEHGTSSMKLHAPARRLARVYLYSCRRCSSERRASCGRNIMSGLVLTARACGNDVARLTFWWSNTTVLREIISTHSSTSPTVPKRTPQTPPTGRIFEDWKDLSTFIAALEQLESWIYTKVVESIWWQVLTQRMQKAEKQPSLEMDDDEKEMRRNFGNHEKKRHPTRESEDARQGNASVEIWKKAFLEAYEKLCPVRVLGVECGCLPMLNILVLEACVGRLDVAMFNAILRDDEVPTDPISDPISDVQVLPIPNSSLSFGRGAQLKNAVSTLSSFISHLTKRDGDIMSDGNSDDDELNIIAFPFLKAMGGLLMLPKDMLMDKSLRKEVCPTLELPFIGRILSKFQPDELSPESIPRALLDTINAEIADEHEEINDNGSTGPLAFSPSVTYNPPQSYAVRQWIGDLVSTDNSLRRSNSSILRKGHTSDDEIDELESPISWLRSNTKGSNGHNRSNNAPPDSGDVICRFMLLREAWNSS